MLIYYESVLLGLGHTAFYIRGHLVREGTAEASCVELTRLVLRELVVQLRGHIEVLSTLILFLMYLEELLFYCKE